VRDGVSAGRRWASNREETIMAKTVEPIPKGYHTITPSLIVRGAERAIEFYKKAFGAEECFRMAAPDGKGIMHADLQIGDSRFFVAEECPERGCRSAQGLGGSPVSLYVYVTDADAAFRRAVAAGAEAHMPVQDMFWGDRYGCVTDPFGYQWGLATRKQELTPEQIRERAEAWFVEMAGKSRS
jgi:PhnB protein